MVTGFVDDVRSMPIWRRWLAPVFAVCLAGSASVTAAETPPPGASTEEDPRAFWAFRPLVAPAVPQLPGPLAEQVRTPIDAFVLRQLAKRDLSFSAAAPPTRLVRRAWFDLLGLPPSPEQAEAFLADTTPQAYERVIDRLLASPHFGERWGRHWLDVVGYTDLVSYDGDTTGIFGFIKGRWRYRDYVIDAFNEDKPYDRFLREQIAGDELVTWRTAKEYTPEMVATLAATGFWRNAEDRSESAKELEYKWSFLYNTMQTFGTGVMGLTLRCARCHDHKHEPIPQRDYFRLLSLITPAFNVENWKNPKERAIPAISAAQKKVMDAANAAINKRVSDLEARVAMVKAARQQQLITAKLQSVPAAQRKALQAALGTPDDKRTAAQRGLFKQFGDQVTVKNEEVDQALTADDKSVIAKHNQQVAELKQQVQTHGWIQAIYDVGPPPATHLLERGEFKTPGEEVRPGFIEVLSAGPDAFASLGRPVAGSSGRRTALAHWLTQPGTPAAGLVARVIVNRLWQHLTGVGIVPTPENLGMSGDPPTHPELLDWLAAELVQNGWRTKPLIKNIMLSATYRQASRRENMSAVKPDPRQLDPENRFLWRARLRRLESEVIRDAMLTASGSFNADMGGQPVPLKYRRDGVASFDEEKLSTPQAAWRRSIYLFQRRVYHLTVLGVFDQPVIAGSVCRRNTSAVALQSLSMMNDTLVLEQADQFAGRVLAQAGDSPEQRIELAFRLALSRRPNTEELGWSSELLRQQAQRYQRSGAAHADAERQALMHLCRVLFNSSEFLYVE